MADNYDLPDELKLFRENLRRFVDKELIPHESRILREGMSAELEADLTAAARTAGYWLLDVPEEFGGSFSSVLALAVFWEEIARTITIPSRYQTIFGPMVGPILLQLNPQQRSRYLDPLLRGEISTCFAQTEPDAGSDPARMRTRAEKMSDGAYRVSGTKRFITNAKHAAFAQLMAVTDPQKGARGISCLLVDMNSPGVTVTREQQTMMGEQPCEIAFDNVLVPRENLVGQEGQGFRLAQTWISHGRIRHGAHGVGLASRCLELAISYAKQRNTFGAPLSDRQGIRWMLADAAIEIHAARLIVHQAAAKIDRGEDARSETYIAKIYGDEMGFRVADRCLQVHGGLGLTTDLPLERMWRDARSFIITEGPTEVLKDAFARRLFDGVG